jgi:hypothetical protein
MELLGDSENESTEEETEEETYATMSLKTKSAQHEEDSIYKHYLKGFPTNPKHTKNYLAYFKFKMLPAYYLEDINSSLKIACTETCDGDVSLTHYIDLVKTYQVKKKELEEIESQLLKSETSMFITMAQMEKDKRLNDLINNDKKFFGNTERNDEDDEEDNDNN